jgi:hypothetical protein
MVKKLLGQLSPQIQPGVAPLVQRWEAYMQKVGARVEEIFAEGDQGLTEIFKMNPLDPGPISGGFEALRSRFHGVTDKIDGAVEKLEQEWDEAVENLNIDDERQQRILRAMWNQMRKRSDGFKDELEKKHTVFAVRKNAEWARMLYDAAMQEWNQPRTCPSCGAQIEVQVKYQASNVACPYCKAVNEIQVGPATGMYFAGAGAYALAEEANLQAYLTMADTEHWYNGLRRPTERDREHLLQVTRAYWTGYYTTLKQLNPGFVEEIPKAAEAKLAHYAQWDKKSDQKERSIYGNIVQLVASRDQAKVQQYVQSLPSSDFSMDEAVYAVHERGDRDGTVMLLRMKHKMEDVDEPIDAWVQSELADLDAG